MVDTIQIRIKEDTLSDGSGVWDVVIGEGDESVILPAVTYGDALALVDKLSAAIAAHTNETVTKIIA